jgi:hypothetical protein
LETVTRACGALTPGIAKSAGIAGDDLISCRKTIFGRDVGGFTGVPGAGMMGAVVAAEAMGRLGTKRVESRLLAFGGRVILSVSRFGMFASGLIGVVGGFAPSGGTGNRGGGGGSSAIARKRFYAFRRKLVNQIITALRFGNLILIRSWVRQIILQLNA